MLSIQHFEKEDFNGFFKEKESKIRRFKWDFKIKIKAKLEEEWKA